MDKLQDNIKKLTDLIGQLKFINKEIRSVIKVTDPEKENNYDTNRN